jgi:hypothetical protein
MCSLIQKTIMGRILESAKPRKFVNWGILTYLMMERGYKSKIY